MPEPVLEVAGLRKEYGEPATQSQPGSQVRNRRDLTTRRL
jgi:hypothetical protein